MTLRVRIFSINRVVLLYLSPLPVYRLYFLARLVEKKNRVTEAIRRNNVYKGKR